MVSPCTRVKEYAMQILTSVSERTPGTFSLRTIGQVFSFPDGKLKANLRIWISFALRFAASAIADRETTVDST